MDTTQLSTCLGKLFYVVAAADGHVKVLEAKQLSLELEKSWINDSGLEPSGFDKNFAVAVWQSFNACVRNSADTNQAWEEFKTFYKENEKEWNGDLKQLVQKTAAAISNSFHGYNKTELQILTDLHLMMK